jgi:predicted PurR-regulated permease PerM
LPVSISLLVMALGLAGMITLGVTVLVHFAQEMRSNLPQYMQGFMAQTADIRVWLMEHGIELPGNGEAGEAGGWLDPQAAMAVLGQTAKAALTILAQAFLVCLIVVFLWLETELLPMKIERYLSAKAGSNLANTANDIRRYIGMKAVMSLLTGLLAGLWCIAMGVPHPLFFGIVAFIFNHVPTIGSIIAAIPAIALALVLYGPIWCLVTAAGYVVINVGVSNSVEPRYMGEGLGLSPLVVVLSMVVWGWVLGPIGMLLSVPLTRVVKIALAGNRDTAWVAVLLGGRPRGDSALTSRLTGMVPKRS